MEHMSAFAKASSTCEKRRGDESRRPLSERERTSELRSVGWKYTDAAFSSKNMPRGLGSPAAPREHRGDQQRAAALRAVPVDMHANGNTATQQAASANAAHLSRAAVN